MKLGILGGTSLAKTLGKKYIHAGISVVFGVSPEFDTEEEEWKMLNRLHHRICPYESAIIQGEILFICGDMGSLPEIWIALKNSDTEGKLIIDCTPTNPDKRLEGRSTYLIQKAAPKAIVFSAFNNLGIEYPLNDRLGKIKETQFHGEDVPETIRVRRLIELIGFKATRVDELKNVQNSENYYFLEKKVSGKANGNSSLQYSSAS
ncbi:MAG: NAD(P)-binding domain-containing protein [Cyclobacteriaceae bacterium]|nr:NAD(P)-binding domain-containing protein [Cyclobacteriaceae bacterium]MDX5466698.1 NAD(P)-binding domain-containing protein [Cyclobacteriaceae bacterium]